MTPDRPCIPAVVLIVEDEMVLRMRAVDMVEDAGYTPLEALDAAEAVAILESRSDVALICTDIHMPGQMDERRTCVCRA
jgi:CheY-like chemotaxis protein